MYLPVGRRWLRRRKWSPSSGYGGRISFPRRTWPTSRSCWVTRRPSRAGPRCGRARHFTSPDRRKDPLLIAQGSEDTRVPTQQAQLMVDALVAAKVPVTYVVYPDEGPRCRPSGKPQILRRAGRSILRRMPRWPPRADCGSAARCQYPDPGRRRAHSRIAAGVSGSEKRHMRTIMHSTILPSCGAGGAACCSQLARWPARHCWCISRPPVPAISPSSRRGISGSAISMAAIPIASPCIPASKAIRISRRMAATSRSRAGMAATTMCS